MSPRRRLAVLLALASLATPAASFGDEELAQNYPPPPPGYPPPPPQGYPPPQPQYAPPPPQYAAPPKPQKRRVELTGHYGWQVNSDAYGYNGGKLTVDDTSAFGATIGVETFPGAFAEFSWIYSNPWVRTSYSSLSSERFNVATNYFQIGGTKGITRDRLSIFGGASIGAAWFSPSNVKLSNGSSASYSDTWRFAFGLDIGLKVDLGEKLALRFDTKLLAPVYFSSGGIYVGGGGAGVTVGGGVPIWQWNFLGGLVFKP